MNRFSHLKLSSQKLVLEGLAFLIVGVLLILFQGLTPMWLVRLFLFISFFSATYNLLSQFWSRLDKMETLFLSFTKTIFTLFLLILIWNGGVTSQNLALSLGSYASFVGATHLVLFFKEIREGSAPQIRYVVDGGLSSLFAISAFLFSDKRASIQILIIGLYAVFLGIMNLYDGVHRLSSLPNRKFKGRWRVALPLVWSIYIPEKLLALINLFLVGKTSHIMTSETSQWDKVEVSLYFPEIKRTLLGGLPVVDIGYKGKVYRYGAYDVTSEERFGLHADGVLAITDEEHYLEQEATDSVEGVYYTILLQADEVKFLEERLKTLTECLEVFEPSEQTRLESWLTKDQLDVTELYKFKDGSLKHYHHLKTSSVALVDYLLEKAIIDRGFVTPAVYKEALAQAEQIEKSRVKKRELF